ALHDQLGNEETRALAADKLRTLVSRIDLVPDRAELVIVLRGGLTAILTFASGKRKPEFPNERATLEQLLGRAGSTEGQKRKNPAAFKATGSQGFLVAGAGLGIFLSHCVGSSSLRGRDEAFTPRPVTNKKARLLRACFIGCGGR